MQRPAKMAKCVLSRLLKTGPGFTLPSERIRQGRPFGCANRSHKPARSKHVGTILSLYLCRKEKGGDIVAKIFRFKDFVGSENARLRSENARLRAQVAMLTDLVDDSIDEVVDLKFSLEEATGVPQN